MSHLESNAYLAQDTNDSIKTDSVWLLGLYGTAIGAGTLFLPINAGMNGMIPLFFMMIIAFPLTFLSHRALCRFVLSGNTPEAGITDVVDEHFGKTAGHLLTLLYFASIFPILLMYSVAITNTVNSFIVNQLHFTAPNRPLLSLILILFLMTIVRCGQSMIIKSMSILVYPFVIALLLIACYLIPYWQFDFSTLFSFSGTPHAGQPLWHSLWMIVPVMIFSFNHSPIISSFAVHHKKLYGNTADKRCNTILKYSHLMMITTVLFFVTSCVFSLSPQDLVNAKHQNISILSYLANHFHVAFIAYIAPIVALLAISKSFLGHYLGTSEGLQGLLLKQHRIQHYVEKNGDKGLSLIVDLAIIFSCWFAASENPSILGMIETLGGPVIAMILLLMPMYALYRVPALKQYQKKYADLFVIVLGTMAMSAILYGLIPRH